MKRMNRLLALRVLAPMVFLALFAVRIGVSGTVCSLSFAATDITCPLGFIQSSLAARGFPLALLVSALIPLAAAALLGRFFCGWICGAGLTLDLTRRISNKRGPRVAKDPDQPIDGRGRAGASKLEGLALLGFFLGISFVLGYPAFCLVCPVGILYRNVLLASTQGTVGLDILAMPVLVAIEVFASKSWCGSLCPVGKTFSLVSAWSLFKPRVNASTCVKCGACAQVCHVNIDPVTANTTQLADCTKCVACRDACPKGSISMKP